MTKKTSGKRRGKKTAQKIPAYFKVLTILVAIGSAYASVRFGEQNLVLAFIAAFVFGTSLMVLRNIYKAELVLKEKANKPSQKKKANTTKKK